MSNNTRKLREIIQTLEDAYDELQRHAKDCFDGSEAGAGHTIEPAIEELKELRESLR